MKIKGIVSIFIILFVGMIEAAPTIISYSGMVSVDGQPFTGTGLFKFTILNAENNASLWSNDGTSVNGSQPSASVGIPVNGGLYSILLGNAAIQGMTGLDPNLFSQHYNTRLRIWFSDGEGFEQLSPDRRFASVPYALSANIPPGSIGSELLSPAVRADLNRTITKSMLGADVKSDLNTKISFPGTIISVPYGNQAPSGYSLYQRGTPKELVWVEKASITQARGFLGSMLQSSPDGKLYALGGHISPTSSYDLVEAYDPISNTWEIKPSLSETSFGQATTTFQGKIFVIGGHDLSKVEIFDPNSNEWTTGTQIPVETRYSSAVSVGGKIFLCGGRESNNILDEVYSFDFVANSWSPKASMLKPRAGHRSIEFRGQIWSIGSDGEDGRTVEIYDLQENTWSYGPSLNTGRSGFSCWTWKNKIFVAGGFNENEILDSIEFYDPKTGQWEHYGKIPLPNKYLSATILNDKIYIFGGQINDTTYTNKVYVADLNASITGVYDLYRKDGNASAGVPTVQAEVADGHVTTNKLSDGSVTAAKIAPGSVDHPHLSPAVRADLNRTITKSMLGSDILNDLNRTITKSMLGTDVLGDLNRTINADELSVGVFAPRFSSSPVEISPPRFADDLNLADLNNDGALDIIDSSGLISLADGTGGFKEPFSIISAGNAGKTLAVADFDNDNYPDIFLGRWQNTHWIFFGDENCTYSRKIEIVPNIDPAGFMKANDSFILDAENDGDLDIILSHGHGVQGLLLTNPGDGNFTFSRPNGLDGVKNFVSGADFNGDGFTDIVSAYFSRPKKNEGDGNFTNFGNTMLWEIGELNHNNGEIIVNDLNGDDENDIILFEGGGRGCTVFFNTDGNGTFELGSKFAVNLINIQSFDLGDLDNDGDADIFLLGDQSAYLFINNGSGYFFRGSHVIQTTSGSSVKLGDLDNDGDLDAVIGRGTHQSHQNLQVWWNDHAKGKVRLGQLDERILNDLNRTITKSMLGSNILNDLNRTINISDLNQQILNYLKPGILTQPIHEGTKSGRVLSLSVNADGKFLSFQWEKNGLPINGKTSPTLQISDSNKTQHEGNYSVVITNDFGSVSSNEVEVKIFDNSYWDRTYGGNDLDSATTLLINDEEQIVVGGRTNSGANGNKSTSGYGNSDFWIIKLNQNGDKLWEKNYGGSQNDVLSKILELEDGYLLAGSSDSGISGNKTSENAGSNDFWVLRLDTMGEKLWEKSFGGTENDVCRDVTLDITDDSFILVGSSDSNSSSAKSEYSKGGNDFWILKINADGKKVWDKTLGGSGYDSANKIIPDGSSQFIVGGTSDSPISGDKSEESRGEKDFWILKIDSTGSLIWEKRFGSTLDDECLSLARTKDHKILVGGYAYHTGGDRTQGSLGNRDLWVLKLEQNSSKIWDRRFGGNSNEYCRDIMVTEQNEFILVGNSDSFNFQDSDGINPDYNDLWILKITQDGDQLWNRFHGGNNQHENGYSGALSPSGDLFLAGNSNSTNTGNKTAPKYGSYDFWIIKADQNGSK